MTPPSSCFRKDYRRRPCAAGSGRRGSRDGVVVAIDPIVDPAGQIFRVKLEVDNSDGKLAAGVTAVWNWSKKINGWRFGRSACQCGTQFSVYVLGLVPCARFALFRGGTLGLPGLHLRHEGLERREHPLPAGAVCCSGSSLINHLLNVGWLGKGGSSRRRSWSAAWRSCFPRGSTIPRRVFRPEAQAGQ